MLIFFYFCIWINNYFNLYANHLCELLDTSSFFNLLFSCSLVLSIVSASFPGNAHCSCNGNKFKINTKFENIAQYTTFKGLIFFFFVCVWKQLETWRLNWTASICLVHLIGCSSFGIPFISCVWINPFSYMLGNNLHILHQYLWQAYSAGQL